MSEDLTEEEIFKKLSDEFLKAFNAISSATSDALEKLKVALETAFEALRTKCIQSHQECRIFWLERDSAYHGAGYDEYLQKILNNPK